MKTPSVPTAHLLDPESVLASSHVASQQMVGKNNGNSNSGRLATRSRVLLAGLLAAVFLVGLYIFYVAKKVQDGELDKLVAPDFWFATSNVTYYIDPSQHNLQRMFYSGGLVSNKQYRHAAASSQHHLSTPVTNVTVFELKTPLLNVSCVPLNVPWNRTLKICIYDQTTKGKDMISAYIHDFGVWEKELVEGMAFLLAADGNEHLQPPAEAIETRGLPKRPPETAVQEKEVSVVDIGCNIGVYTLAAGSLGYKVLAVDPVRSSLELLATSLQLANLTSRVRLLLNALSSTRGPVTVHINPTNMGGSSVSHNHDDTRRKVSDSWPTVWAVCLNDLVPYVRTRRVFLKLDVEGWEERALRCAGQFFQHFDVRFVLMEWLFHRQSSSGPQIINFMVRNGLLPYSDCMRTHLLTPTNYFSWPDNVIWIKR